MTHQPVIPDYSAKYVKIHDGDLDDLPHFDRIDNEKCPCAAPTARDVDRNLLHRLPS